MRAEGILPHTNHAHRYAKQSGRERNDRKRNLLPIDAITCDIVDISDDGAGLSGTHTSLVAMISAMNDKDVARKVGQYKQTFADIDDAVAESIIFDAL